MDHGTLKCHVLFSKDHFQSKIVICQIQLPYKIITNVTIRWNAVKLFTNCPVQSNMVLWLFFCSVWEKKFIWLPNPGFRFSSLWILWVQKCFVACMPKQTILCAQKVDLIKFSMAKKCLLIQWGRNPSVRMRGRSILHILPHLQSRSKARSFSSLLPIKNAPAKTPMNISKIFRDTWLFSALFPTLYALNQKMLVFTSKALPQQTASFIEGVPYSHLRSCLNYLISDPFICRL